MTDPTPILAEQLGSAFQARHDLLAQLAAEDTTCYRLFHGSVEGTQDFSGLTIDRYGSLLLVQSFHRGLDEAALAVIDGFYADAQPGLTRIYNDRSQRNSRIANPLSEEEKAFAHLPIIVSEVGVKYQIQARHQGQDPWLFLDLRAARRRVIQEAKDKSVLNLFAYTCGVGIAAAKAGANFVVNVDFAESSLQVGKGNAGLNDLPHRPRFVKSDVFAAARQYAGIGQPEWVRGKRMPPFPKLEARQFDLVFLDPPRYARSPFGVVDLIKDYPGVFKPALLSTAEGGTLICSNNVAQVNKEEWLDQLERSATKAGRPIKSMEWILPEADFPSHDGQYPLKLALLRV